MTKLAFKVSLDGMEGSSVAALSAPFSVEKVFGTKARVPVRGTINDFRFVRRCRPWRAAIAWSSIKPSAKERV
jgi:hypothetical protein